MIALSAIEARQRSSLKPRKGSNLAVPITISQTQAQGKGLVCGFLCPATDGPPVPSFADDQDEDEPEDQSEDQDADADEPEDQSEDQSEGD